MGRKQGKRAAAAVDPALTSVVHRNIAAILEFRERNDRALSSGDRVADRITRWLGTVPSVLVHAALIGAWLVWNARLVPGLRPFDPPPFVLLAVCASLESILLTLFVLVSQNRLAHVEQRQNELDLQINLLAEHEITQLLLLTEAIARKLDVAPPSAIEELKRDVHPQAVLDEIEKASRTETVGDLPGDRREP